MVRVILFLFLIGAIPWTIVTWWEMRRSQSARERAWVGRVSLGVWLGSLLGAMAVVLFTMRGQLLALPVFGATGLAAWYGLRRARSRIRAEEGDPLSRAKRLN
jgi:hypothetical protein